MSMDIQALLEGGRNPNQIMLEATRGLQTKWDRTGLLEGLQGVNKGGMAVLLENQAHQLLSERTSTGTTSNSEQWSGVALPLVRRIFGEIAAKEFVSVQPMNLPSGLVFYVDFKFGTAQAGQPAFLNQSLFGSDGGSGKLGSTQVAEGGLYGPGRFGYSINDQSTGSLAFTTASATWGDVGFRAELSASVAAGEVWKVTTTVAGANKDDEGVRAFVVSASAGQVSFFPEFTSVSGDAITFLTSGSAPAPASQTVTVQYHKQPTDSTRGDFEDTTGADIGIPEVELEVKSETIVAKTRKLKAIWTPEMAQDLNSYHSVDAEAELTGLLSEFVSLEIDLEILDMLIKNTLTTEYWSAKPGYEFSSLSAGFVADTSVAAASAYTKGTWYQTLGNKIQKVSNKILQLTMRGGANFLVTSPDVATILESIPGFSVDTEGDSAQFAMGVSRVGTLRNRWTVYKNPYMTENIILVGFKGNSFLETGAVYAPYVPLILTPLVYDPTNFTPRRGVMTRYAKKMVRPEFYGKVVVADLNYV